MNGYIIIKVPRGTPGTITYGGTLDRWIFEHRYVMQQALGRTLRKDETVHHRNGDKTDNRPENLELWRGWHGKGVRVSDYHCPGCRCFEHQETHSVESHPLDDAVLASDTEALCQTSRS